MLDTNYGELQMRAPKYAQGSTSWKSAFIDVSVGMTSGR